MRLLLMFGFVVAICCSIVDFTGGQQPQGGGFGGVFGGKQKQDTTTLLRNAGVKKELKLTPEQEAKIPAAVMEAMAKVLNPDQLKRLKEIELQNRDYTVFTDSEIQAALKMTEFQQGSIKIIVADAEKETQALNKEMQDALKGLAGGGGAGGAGGKGGGGAGAGGKGGAGGFGNFGALQGNQGKIQTIAKEAKARCEEVLTAPQKRAWMEMLGEDFKIEQGFPGGFDLKGFDFKGKKGGG